MDDGAAYPRGSFISAWMDYRTFGFPHDHIMVHSPSLFLLTADRETRVFCFAGFPCLNSSSLPLALSNPWLALFQYQRLASSRFAGAPIPYK